MGDLAKHAEGVTPGWRRPIVVFLIVALVTASVPAAATVYDYLYSNNTGTVQNPSVTLVAGTAGSTTVSAVAADAATSTFTSGLTYYETVNAPTSCASPTVDTSTTASGTTGSFTITSGQTACLWTPAYSGSTPIPAGNTVYDLWASSTVTPSNPSDQTTGASGGTSTTPTCAYGTNVVGGALLVVSFLVSPSSITVSSPTDTLGSTWSQVVTKTGGSTVTFAAYIYAAQAAGSGADTVTLHFTGTVTDSYLTCFEAIGASVSTDATSNGAGTATSGGSYSAAATSYTCTAGDLCYAFVAYQPCGTSSAPTYDAAFTSMTARGADFAGATTCRTSGSKTYGFNAADEFRIPVTTASQTSTFALGFGSAITTGTWGWAEVVAVFKPSTTLTVSEFTTNSAGTHQNTMISSGITGAIGATKSEVLTTFSSSSGTVPASGYIELTFTASASVTVFWGTGQATNFQTPGTFNYILQISNPTSTAYSVSLGVASTSGIARISSLVVSFVSPSSTQVVITGGSVTQSSGSLVTLSAGGTINIQVVATASSVGSSVIIVSLKVLQSSTTPYALYTINLNAN